MEEESPSAPETPPAPQQARDIFPDSEAHDISLQEMAGQAPAESTGIEKEQNPKTREEDIEAFTSTGVLEEETEALRLKSLADDKYSAKDFKAALKHAKKAARLAPDLHGIPQMVTALRVLRSPCGDHYRALLIEPFSNLNAVRRQYKALALILHPDKNPSSISSFPGSEEAFKRVCEAFRILSDPVLREDYDEKLKTGSKSKTFWTACEVCRLFHQFDRKYLKQRLVCPRCKKSFLAEEVPGEGSEGARKPGSSELFTTTRSGRLAGVISRSLKDSKVQVKKEIVSEKRKKVSFADAPDGSVPKKPKEKTLAEIQNDIKMKFKSRAKTGSSGRKEKNETKVEVGMLMPSKKRARDLVAMVVEDSDFYDFDKHRTEKSFKKGQIWGVYDDDDGMPRHYGLIYEVFSTNPFKLTMNWLDIQMGSEQDLHISSGEFKVGKKVEIDSVNLFSHQMDFERAAKEIYRIYPQKGSVWALYKEGSLQEERDYDIVVVLSSFSEDYGLTMAYLEKVEGFKTIFKRREIGCHAIRWQEKCKNGIFSHQIPARKITDREIRDAPRDCWELDPASLSSGLLQIGWNR